LERALAPYRGRGLFGEFPFGTDLTAEEVVLARALKSLEARTGSAGARLGTVAAALLSGRPEARHAAALKRMGLERPRSPGEYLQQRLVVLALNASG
jgi:hypothetical protein